MYECVRFFGCFENVNYLFEYIGYGKVLFFGVKFYVVSIIFLSV